MRINWSWILFFGMVIWTSCQKEDSQIIVHTGVTRIDYEVNNIYSMPHIEFDFNTVQDLSEHTSFSIELIANAEAESLSLMIMLEDANGDRSNAEPMIISTDQIIRDDIVHQYQFNLMDHLSSTTSISHEVDLGKIDKILLFINSDLFGKEATGFFWLDKMEFSKP